MDCRTNQIRDIYHVVGKLTVVAPILASHEKKTTEYDEYGYNTHSSKALPPQP